MKTVLPRMNFGRLSESYRPDVDGLRAVAVSGVIFYHLQSVDFLPGGFLGVDIFFVISGFLITRVILKDLRAQSFSFKGFYLRRARRLLPGFFLVAIATIVAAYVFLDPSRMLDFTHSLLFSLAGLSNIYFMFQDPYWADTSSTIPFLHTWSLAVEEQFYLFFPAALFLASRFLRKQGRIIVFGSIGLFSLFLAYSVSQSNPTFAFYLLPTRAWELVIGVMLALLLDEVKLRIPQLGATIIAASGLILIFISYLYLGPLITAPSVLTIVPTLGAALVILGGTTANPISKSLGARPLVGVGLISYSLYLWHYPIFAITEVAVGTSLRIQLAGISLAIILSVITYLLVETPFRRRKWNAGRKAMAIAATVSTILFGAGSLITNGYKSPSPVPEALTVESQNQPMLDEAGNTKSRTIAVFGDSHMATLVPGLAEKSQSEGLEFLDGTLTSCLFLRGLANESFTNCSAQFQESRIQAALKISPSFVILGGRYPLALEGSRFNNQEGGVESGGLYRFISSEAPDLSQDEMALQISESTRETAKALLNQGNILVLIYPIPEVGWDVPSELTSRSVIASSSVFGTSTREFFSDRGISVQWHRFSTQTTRWPLDTPLSTAYDVYLERTRSTFELFDSITGHNVIRVYPHRLFCEEKTSGRCATHSQTDVWYSDDDHLSVSGAALLSTEIIKAVREYDTHG